MKKFFFPLLTLVLTVVTFASCSSNDDNNSPSGKTYYGALYRITDSMAELGDFKVTISDGTKTSEYDIVKNGKHGSYDFGINDKKDIISGYEFTITQPSDKALKYTVTYTPNAKAKALTENDKIDALCVFGYASGSSSTLTFATSVFGGKGLKGNYAIDRLNYIAEHMSK